MEAMIEYRIIGKQKGGKLERAGKQLGGGKRERERIRGKDDKNVWQYYDIKLKN